MTLELAPRENCAGNTPHGSFATRFYGSAERFVSYLTEELVCTGQDVTLFASGDSVSDDEIDPVWPSALRFDSRVRDVVAPHFLLMERVCR